MTHEEFIAAVKALVVVDSHSQAEHCGYHHFELHGSEDVVLKVVRAARANYCHGTVMVGLRSQLHPEEPDELAYWVSLPSYHAQTFVENLQKEFA